MGKKVTRLSRLQSKAKSREWTLAGAKEAVAKKRSAKSERLEAVSKEAARKKAERDAKQAVTVSRTVSKASATRDSRTAPSSLSLTRLRTMVGVPTNVDQQSSLPQPDNLSTVQQRTVAHPVDSVAEHVDIPFDEDEESSSSEEEEQAEHAWYSSAMPPHFLTLDRSCYGDDARTPTASEKVAVAPGVLAQVRRSGRLAESGPISMASVARDLATLLPRYARQPALSAPTNTTALLTWAARRGADVLATCRPSKPAVATATMLPALAAHVWATVGEARALVEANDRRVAASTAAATKARFAGRLAARLRADGDVDGAAAVEAASRQEVGIPAAVPASVRDGPDVTLLDQGFQRPSVLLLVPTRAAAHTLIHALMSVLPPAYGDAVPGLSRFAEEYGPASEGAVPAEALSGKPDDYVDLFAGNQDDAFRLGLSINAGRVKAYTALVDSDIIIASPLGMRLLAEQSRIKNKERASAAAAAKRRADERSGRRGVLAAASVTSGSSNVSAAPDVADFTAAPAILSVGDLLSSISLLVVDQAEVLLHAQNAEHAEAVARMLNRLPRHPGDTDFGRVRPYFLDGQAAAHRQTIVLARYPTPDVRSFFTRHSRAGAVGGTLDLTHIPDDQGVLPLLGRPHDTRHIVRRITVPRQSRDPSVVEDARLNHFLTHLLPALRAGSLPGCLIYVNDSLDFNRVAAALAKESVDCAMLSEDVSDTAAKEAKRSFAAGMVGALLLSGRHFFYHRTPPRGTRHLIFYSLPLHAPLFATLATPHPSSTGALTVVSLVSSLDAAPLARILGRSRARNILNGKQDIRTL
eukprot:CAMPEP_0170752844 /NCGR_PEP_ID=MMETSP0437-20130122/12179_1 /TAXON_ID=0 /ORGANISM="Sexangularia sp." /LENGTH=810 /DNA_ID=CAMNT_0011091929 /DNA_START=44 /DNA_END=2476 /DNA_ORIENTATION=+